MKIKRLSEETHQRLLGYKPQPATPRAQKQMEETWVKFGLGDAIDHSELVELQLPNWLRGHEQVASDAVSLYGKPYLNRLDWLSRMDVPKLPGKPNPHPGWQCYAFESSSWLPSEKPVSDTAMVLDFETVEVGDQWLPICAVVMTDEAWYTWSADLDKLQTTIDFATDQAIIGHNCPYDRSYLTPEYFLEDSGNRWYDTMAAWIATRGFCNQQRPVYTSTKDGIHPDWVARTATNGLDAVYEFYTGKKLDKGVRSNLVEEGMPFVRYHMAEVIWYCIKDVQATFEVFRHVYGENRNSQPSEISHTAQLLLGSCWLPLSDRWANYYDNAEAKYREVIEDVQQRLNAVAQRVLEDPSEVQRSQLDWTPAKTGKAKGQPKWFRDCKGQPKISGRLTPILLGCSWRGLPVLWSDETGWHTSEASIPHPENHGQRVTDLFAKGFAKAVDDGVLDAPGGLKDLLVGVMSTINWVSLRQRVAAVKVEVPEGFRVTLPRLTVTGTVTRRCADNVWMVASNPKPKRIGTELKSMVEAPPGYCLVGADVASQELWIASALGDAATGYCGATPLGLMTLIGVKADKTDVHSVIANRLGISRDTAKNIVYGLIYGLGLKGVVDYIAKSNPDLTRDRCDQLGRDLLSLVKGAFMTDTDYKDAKLHKYVGGLASEAFNAMDKVANSQRPETPALRASISKALMGVKDYKTTRVNWVIQSSGCDFRDLLVVYTRYCYERLGVKGRLLLNIHDEIRTMVAQEDAEKAAYALQLAHLLTRAAFIDKLGLDCIPAGIAWYPEVDIDTVLRKDPVADQVTPSQPVGISAGQSLSPAQLTTYLQN